DPLAMCLGRHHLPVPTGGEAEALKRLDVELQDSRVDCIDESHRSRSLEICLVRVFEIPLIFGQLILPKTTVRDIALKLVGVGRAPARLFAGRTAPAAKRPDTRPAFVINDIIGIASGITRYAFRCGKARQPEPGADFDQDVLKWPDIAVRGNDWLTNGIGRPLHPADRPIKQGNAIPAFKISRVRED